MSRPPYYRGPFQSNSQGQLTAQLIKTCPGWRKRAQTVHLIHPTPIMQVVHTMAISVQCQTHSYISFLSYRHHFSPRVFANRTCINHYLIFTVLSTLYFTVTPSPRVHASEKERADSIHTNLESFHTALQWALLSLCHQSSGTSPSVCLPSGPAMVNCRAGSTWTCDPTLPGHLAYFALKSKIHSML